MAEGKEKKLRRSRRLTEDERKLWRAVTKDTTPLSRARMPEPDPAMPSGTVLPVEPTTLSPMQSQAARPAPPAPSRMPGPPPLTGLDRRLSQRLARGQMEVEATLDLHGHTQERAHGALLDFLSRGRARGLRCVLVITGKGPRPTHGTRFTARTSTRCRSGKVCSGARCRAGSTRPTSARMCPASSPHIRNMAAAAPSISG